MTRRAPAPAPALLALALAFGGCADDNRAPSLALLLDQQVVVGETLRVVLTASDPDGDRLTFAVRGLPKGAQVTPRAAQEAVLVWSPLITDTQPGGRRYELDVEVDDGRGGKASQRVGLVAYPTFGVPTFDLPAGVVLNLAEDDALELLVEVKDDDSTEVDLQMTEGPAGARLQLADKKIAHFYWEPDDEQRKVAVHRAIFAARDESGTTVSHVLTIVLLNAEKQSGCSGQPPTVTHAVPPDANASGPLEVFATAKDGQSQVQSMTLHWTRGDPAGSYAAAAMTRLQQGGSDFRASVDLGALPNGGSLVHYYLVATDNDDPTGIACDQSARVPKTGWFTAAVYPAGTPGSVCVDDAGEPDDSPSGAVTLKAGTYSGRRLCGPDVDVVGVDAPAGTTVVATVTWPPEHGALDLAIVDGGGSPLATAPSGVGGVASLSYERTDDRPIFVEVSGDGGRVSYTLELAVEETRCEDDGAEPDSSPDAARPLSLGGSASQRLCPGDSDFFAIAVGAGQTVHLGLAFDHRYGDLDLELRGPDGVTVLARSASEKSLEEVTWTAESGGTLVARVYGVDGASNAYSLSIDQDAQVGCPEDGLGRNTSADDAATLFQDVYEGFAACEGAPDWFVVDLNDSETLDLLVLADDPANRVGLRAFRELGGQPIAVGAPDADGFAELSIAAQGPERIYYEVAVEGAGTATYSLLQEVRDPPGACRPDRFEPNAVGAPVAISSGIHTWLRLCGDTDTDAFRIVVPAFSSVVAFTVHAEGEAFTDLELRDPSGGLVADEVDLGEGAYIEEFVEPAGDYVLYVKPYTVGDRLGYDLAIFVD